LWNVKGSSSCKGTPEDIIVTSDIHPNVLCVLQPSQLISEVSNAQETANDDVEIKLEKPSKSK
jgi:hypothetical protein